jgi:hypothetical protein
MPRSILTVVPDLTNQYLLRQNLTHGIRHKKVLSAAKIARALLMACSVAEVPLGEQADEEAITAMLAEAFRHTGPHYHRPEGQER